MKNQARLKAAEKQIGAADPVIIRVVVVDENDRPDPAELRGATVLHVKAPARYADLLPENERPTKTKKSRGEK